MSKSKRARRSSAADPELSMLMGLPHYCRYSNTRQEALAEQHPVRIFLKEQVESRVARHRPAPNEPHCKAPKLKVVRVEQIFTPRLQQKYLAEAQDIAGLCEGGRIAVRLEGKLDAPRVSYDVPLRHDALPEVATHRQRQPW